MDSPQSSGGPKRTLLVVDGSYLMISASKMNLKINYIKLVQELERKLGCEFYEKWFINGESSNNNNAFNNMLRAAPPAGPQFRVKILGLKTHTSFCKNCKRDVESRVQKGVDVSIATLILKHSFQNHCDQVVLIAGDGDFYDALSTAKDELRKELVLVGFQDHTLSLDLQQLANKVIWINTMIDLIRDVPVPQTNQNQPRQFLFQPQPQQQSQPQPQPQQLQHLHFQMQPQPQQPQTQQPQQVQPQQPQLLNSQPPLQAPQTFQKVQPPVCWSCNQCTFVNQPTSRYCDICASPRPLTSIAPIQTTPTTPTTPATPTTPSPFPSPAATPSAAPTPVPTLHVPATFVRPTALSPSPVPSHVPSPAPVISSPFPTSPTPVAPQTAFFFQTHPPTLPQKSPLPPAQEKVYPCPVCTFHRASDSTCEMCGYCK